ncbi:MAG: hypothetical protein JW741_15030 [Sedimentisphaerales bacterium]|nr:hypothetical protein [Sedimentisphaerales bacterium]
MNESTHTIVLLCCALSLIALPGGVPAAEPSAASGPEAAARNPFTALLSEPEPPPAAPEEPAPVVKPPDLRLETVVLKFLDAKSVQSVLQKMVSDRGMVAINEKNNSVVICDDEVNLTRILAEIEKADVTPPQVMVEVVILDVKLGDDTEIGINWDLLSSDRYDVVYRQNFTGERLESTPENAETLGFATAFNTIGRGGDFSVVSGTVRHVLHLIQEKRDVEILASPRALVVSGASATIKAVEEIPYQEVMDTATGGANALTSTEFKEVGVNLQVSATVTDGNSIFLEVDAQQNVRTGESDSGIPVVDTRQATTSLLLADGQTVIIGGLRREEKTVEIDQVPLLGDLPLVGWFFKSRRTIATHSELVVLLAPHIDAGEPVPEHIAEKVDSLRRDSPLQTKAAQQAVSQEEHAR